jgi:hypothetical protein
MGLPPMNILVLCQVYSYSMLLKILPVFTYIQVLCQSSLCKAYHACLLDCLLNCCWSSPAQSFLFLVPRDSWPYFIVFSVSLLSQKSKSRYDQCSLGQSSLHLGPKTRFLLLSAKCGFVDVGALSDERTGLSSTTVIVSSTWELYLQFYM